MPIPDPFTPIALTASIIANIATDILKHHAQTLDGTVAGRMLKWAGLVEPDFNERLHSTLSEALDLYFQTHPEYKLTGIASFLSNQSTAQQIGDYILNRKPFDYEQIREDLYRHMEAGYDGKIAGMLIEKRGLNIDRVIPAFLECYSLTLKAQVRVPHMAILLEIMEQSSNVIEEVRLSEQRLEGVVSQVLESVNSQAKLLSIVSNEQQAIKEHLGLGRLRAAIAEEIEFTLRAAPRSPMFEAGGLCSGYPLKAIPDHYFIAQEFSSERDDLRDALTKALAEFGVTPICADDSIWSGHILCKTSALIQGTPFGVYQLTVSQNRNVYLEFGIAIGLGRPFVLVKDRMAEISRLAQGLEHYSIDSYLELRYELGHKIRPFLTSISTYKGQQLPPASSQRTAIISHGDIDVIDFCIPIAKTIAGYNLLPVILGDPTGKLSRFMEIEHIPHRIISSDGRIHLDEVVSATQAAHFGVHRIEKIASPDAFLALGISMGLNRPGFLIHRDGHDLPSDVKGLNALKFNSYNELNQSFTKTYSELLRRYN